MHLDDLYPLPPNISLTDKTARTNVSGNDPMNAAAQPVSQKTILDVLRNPC